MVADSERLFPVAAATVTIVSLPGQRDARVDRLQERVTEIESRFAVTGIEEVADDRARSAARRGQLGHGPADMLADAAALLVVAVSWRSLPRRAEP